MVLVINWWQQNSPLALNTLLLGFILAGVWLLASALLFQAAIWVWRQAQGNQLDSSGDSNGSPDSPYRKFVANLTHDISNPLQNILVTLANTAELAPDEGARRQQYQQIIRADIDYLVRLTEEAKLLAQLDAPTPTIVRQRVNIERLAADIIFALGDSAERQGVRLTYRGTSRPPHVYGDRDKLKRVLYNLVDNSIKYSPPANDTAQGEVVLEVVAQSQQLAITVSDNGLGMTPEQVAALGNAPFLSRGGDRVQIKGTGLGLAIVQRILAQHDTTLQVTSVLGQGSTFSFTLPIFLLSDSHESVTG